MTIKEYMLKHQGEPCINYKGLHIGIDNENHLFYYHKGNGPYVFGLALNLMETFIENEIDHNYLGGNQNECI